jgi:integrase
MRGSIFQRSPGSWTIVLSVGRKVDPVTGRLKRVQQWRTVRGTKRQAQEELTTMLHNLSRGQVISPSRMTLAGWLDEWLESVIKPHKRLRTYDTYQNTLEKHIKPALGQYRLCDLRASHLQLYYQARSADLSLATLQTHHAILHSALKAAVFQDLIPRNAASLVIGKPRRKEKHEEIIHNCWEADEARQFLDTAKANGSQAAALYTLALDSGMRKAELCGLQWKDLDMDQRRVSVVRQLVKIGHEPMFGPPKNGKVRTVDLDERTIDLLRKHKAAQAAQRLLLGTAYKDHGLVFTRHFGQPVLMNNLGQREYARLLEQSGVKKITFHGLRHTCATLALKAGIPVKVVAERLGHMRIEMTLNVYAHALPSMQQEAAAKLGSLLHGSP